MSFAKKMVRINSEGNRISCEYSDLCGSIELLPFMDRFTIKSVLKCSHKRAVYHVIDKKKGFESVLKVMINGNIDKDSLDVLKFVKCNKHPNIYEIYEIGEVGSFFIVLSKYIDGVLFNKFVKTADKKQLIKSIHSVIYAINYLHRHKICHVDIKPSNILVDKDNNPKLIDFDLARRIRGEYKLEKVIMGTFPYIPKEIFEDKKYYLKSDVWSFGVSIIKSFYYNIDDSTIDSLSKSTKMTIHDFSNNNPNFYEEYSNFDCSLFREKIGKKMCNIVTIMVTMDVKDRPTSDQLIKYIKHH